MKMKVESFVYDSPINFYNNEKKDVSIIIPVYKSQDVIDDLINSIATSKNDIETEIIFADDACPNNTKQKIISTCLKYEKELFPKYSIKIIYNKKNYGYGGNCNFGSRYTSSENLIFLNADTKVTDHWIEPMIKHLKNEKIGMVGNLQLRHGGRFTGAIDSAGSEWHPMQKAFFHIGGRIYKGKMLNVPYYPNNAPSDVLQTSERQMVTGCCFAIRKGVFVEIGMYDENYKIGYYEDADMCLKLKERGYKILFEPSSVIYHKKHHTNSLRHPFMGSNRNYFFNKWINNNKILDILKN
jgi:GT2 family glycosyltransferase